MTSRSALAMTTALLLCAATCDAQTRRGRRTTADAGAARDAGAAADAGVTTDPYARFDALLRAVVRPAGVDYAALRGRVAELRDFHDWLGAHGPRATPGEFSSGSARKAYWLNAYNATVLRGVAEAPAAMNNVLTYLPSNGFFHGRRWHIDGRDLTLDDIENHEVREVFHDARVHFALNCAARSCPPLRAGAYRADRVDAQLDEQARSYFADASRAVLDEGAHTMRVVQLFEWFRDDFAARIPGHPASTVTGPLGFIHAFVPAALQARITAACGADGARCTLIFVPYDWTLNNAR